MKVKSLKEICLIFVGANFHAIGQGPFASMPAELKHKILQSVCLRRKNFTPAEFQFFIEPSDHLTSLDLSQCRTLNENHFELMATKLRQLVSLNVAGCVSVTYDVLQRITESCPHIRQLTLSGCPKVTDSGVALVATTYHTNLTRLELNECFEVTDNSLASLSEQCTNIKALHLGYCQYITDKGTEMLCRALPTNPKMSYIHLEEITLDYCTELTDKAIQQLVSFNSTLRYLSMSGCKITDNAIRYVAGYCARLVTLNVKECDMLTDYTITVIAQRCKGLEAFDGSCGGRYTDASAQQLALYSHQLKSLSLARSAAITNASLGSIALGCSRIESLNINGTQVSDEGLKQLVTSCRNLKQLDVSFCKRLTVDGIRLLLTNCPSLQKLAMWGITVPDDIMLRLSRPRPDLHISRTHHKVASFSSSSSSSSWRDEGGQPSDRGLPHQANGCSWPSRFHIYRRQRPSQALHSPRHFHKALPGRTLRV